MRSSRLSFVTLVLVALGGFAGVGEAATFHSTDVLLVAYQPGGREFVANLGPAAGYLSATSPIDITQYTASDLAGAYGGSVPSDLRLAVFASAGVDTYVATNGPSDPSLVGSAIGASNRIRSMGGNFASSSTPVSGNPNAGTFEFGDLHSYQATLNNPYEGSLGSTVPFNVESGLPTVPTLVPFYQGQFSPFSGAPASQSLLGYLRVDTDGTLQYFPLHIQAACSTGPQTINPKAQGATFGFSVTLTDVTDPDNPQPVDLSRMAPASLSRVGSTSLPVPFAGPGCSNLLNDGIWETLSSRTPLGINFVNPSDGDCSTLDGNRQDLIAVLGRDTGSQPICFSSMIDGNAHTFFTCCDVVNVLDKARR